MSAVMEFSAFREQFGDLDVADEHKGLISAVWDMATVMRRKETEGGTRVVFHINPFIHSFGYEGPIYKQVQNVQAAAAKVENITMIVRKKKDVVNCHAIDDYVVVNPICEWTTKDAMGHANAIFFTPAGIQSMAMKSKATDAPALRERLNTELTYVYDYARYVAKKEFEETCRQLRQQHGDNVASLKTDHAERERELQSEYKQQLAKLQTDQAQLEEALSELQIENNKLKTALSELETKNEDLQTNHTVQLCELQTTHDHQQISYTQQLSEKDRQITDLRTDHVDLHGKIAESVMAKMELQINSEVEKQVKRAKRTLHASGNYADLPFDPKLREQLRVYKIKHGGQRYYKFICTQTRRMKSTEQKLYANFAPESIVKLQGILEHPNAVYNRRLTGELLTSHKRAKLIKLQGIQSQIYAILVLDQTLTRQMVINYINEANPTRRKQEETRMRNGNIMNYFRVV